ncbi:5-bromo-4-chloroindolyl phosphate hydrolysis family protein [Actibacterium pelagium]|uniref:5-bromo-4-chloroindolyl phosphate hydrolysis protein n=1 Tax=Actibacterium pelagium TaxID=2029103 RepID=A0A917ABE8_9RHOB|nr:5-bromo-4-chloroindolyl phosphate hydrolysis family protein [Actibacterium pelagium]GGE38079.1 hypothetical protein GCM10011517_02300 [Actibacterium pelagium]
MAQRYGGKFSPDGSPDNAPTPSSPFKGKRRSRIGGRVNMLFFAPIPLVFQAFGSEPVVMATYLAAFGTLMLAAWLTREGLLAQESYDSRKVAKRPAIPRKLFGSILTGAGLAIAGFAGHGPIEAMIFAALGAILHGLAFGLDPMKDKGAEGIDSFQQDRVARAVDEAEKHLSTMFSAIQKTADRGLVRRVEEFQATARDLFRTVEEDPRDLTAARKYMGVYLMGAKDATVKFADLYSRNRDANARRDYEDLLTDLEQNFAARTQALLLDDRSDLTVEIEVLRERLQREGVRLETAPSSEE